MENIQEIIKTSNDNINIQNFISMYNVLKEINDKEKHKKYKSELKELIQLIIDYLIFGDKKKVQIYFDNFCELDFMQEFIRASKSKTMDILLQIIKSLSSLILTITDKAFLFYLFSNNFINNIITNDKIIESSEDFLSFYINFLKSLSLKIDVTTIKLFFHPEKNSFPLLENALKLYNYEDSMIRNVVKNIFLRFANLSTEYLPLKEFLMSLPIIKFFCFIACRLTDMTIDLNEFAGYNILYKYNSQEFEFKYEKLKALHDDLIDEILYVNDIFGINDSQITFVFLNTLFYYYICPLLLGSIYNYKFFFFPNNRIKNDVKYLVSPEIALYILTLFFSNVHNDSLLNILCILLFRKDINIEIINKFINVQFNDTIPIFPFNYSYKYKDQKYKEKNLTFCRYIAYNFNKNFICNLIMQKKKNVKYFELLLIINKFEKSFGESFEPSEHYNEILNDVNSKLFNFEKQIIRDHHDIISKATGVQSGLSQNEYKQNFLYYLNNEKNMGQNPLRKILFEEIFKYNFEIVNFGLNVLFYSLFYNVFSDDNTDMNKSLSRKMLYYECEISPYDFYVNKNIMNKTIIAKEENNKDNNINNIIDDNSINKNNNNNNNENEDITISTKSDSIDENEIKNGTKNEIKNEKYINDIETLMIFKTEKYELKYNDDENIYKKEFHIDNDFINNLINLLSHSHPYCPLQILLYIYNIKYLTYPININKNLKNIKPFLSEKQKIKLLSTLIGFISIINNLIKNRAGIKYISFESLENIYKLYNENYIFNTKSLITKYILTPFFICIPSVTVDIEDFPFKMNNNKFIFETFIIGYLALYELIYGKKKYLQNQVSSTNLVYKVGDIINLEKINIHDKKISILKVLIKKKNKDEFDEITLFVNNNSIIFGNEEKDEETGEINIKIKNIHPLRELEICLENSFPNSLQFYFKKINYVIKCESDEKRREIKKDIETKRNDIQKYEIDSLIKFFAEEENNYSLALDNDKFNFYMGTKSEDEII